MPLTTFEDMNALQKFGMLMMNVSNPQTIPQYSQMLDQQKTKTDEENRRKSLAELAPQLQTMQPNQALAKIAEITGDPSALVQYSLQQNDPMRQMQMKQMQGEQQRQQQLSALAGLARGGQVVPEQGVGPIQPTPPMGARDFALRASEITGDPGMALKALSDQGSSPFEGSGIEAQALNKILAVSEKERMGQPVSEIERAAANLARQRLERQQIAVDETGIPRAVGGYDLGALSQYGRQAPPQISDSQRAAAESPPQAPRPLNLTSR
jgi:hypothetical protein